MGDVNRVPCAGDERITLESNGRSIAQRTMQLGVQGRSFATGKNIPQGPIDEEVARLSERSLGTPIHRAQFPVVADRTETFAHVLEDRDHLGLRRGVTNAGATERLAKVNGNGARRAVDGGTKRTEIAGNFQRIARLYE